MGDIFNKDLSAVYRGVVEDNEDPEGLGRCRVRVPPIHGPLNYPVRALPWARPIVPSPVGREKGTINIPDIGDIVWVWFEGANRDYPVYLGGVYARDELGVSNDIVIFYTEKGDKISYNRVSRLYSIEVGESTIEISGGTIKLVGNTLVEGDLSVSGNLTVSGNTTLNNLVILGSCNKEGG